MPADRLADEWALESPRTIMPNQVGFARCSRPRPTCGSIPLLPPRQWTCACPPLAPLPTLFDSFAGLGRFATISTDLRTGLAGATESLTVTRRNGEPVTIRFGGIAKMGEREEMISVPGGPPGSPPRMIPNKVFSSYRFAHLDGNPLFVVPAEKLPDLFATTSALVDSQVARFNRDEVREIVLHPSGHPEIKLAMTKGNPKSTKAEEKENRWFIDAKPNPILADTARVNELLDQLSGFRAGEPERNLYPAEPARPSTRVTIITRNKRPDGEPDGPAHELTLLLGPPNYAKRQLPVQLAGWPRTSRGQQSWLERFELLGNWPSLPEDDFRSHRPTRHQLSQSQALRRCRGTRGRVGRGPVHTETRSRRVEADLADRFQCRSGKAGELVSALTGLSATELRQRESDASGNDRLWAGQARHSVRFEFKGGRFTRWSLARPGPAKARSSPGSTRARSSACRARWSINSRPASWACCRSRSGRQHRTRYRDRDRAHRSPRRKLQTEPSHSNWNLSGPFTAPVPFANAQPLLASLWQSDGGEIPVALFGQCR